MQAAARTGCWLGQAAAVFARVMGVFFLAVIVLNPAANSTAKAQNLSQPGTEVRIPGFGAPDLRPPKPQVGAVTSIRFLTAPDFPPFNFVDTTGSLVGFNVDIAREICLVMEIECTLTAEDWSSLPLKLNQGRGDAVIASIATTALNRDQFDFSTRYHFSPARFVSRARPGDPEVTPELLAGKNVGVVRGTAHAAYLAAFFGDAIVTGYANRAAVRKALMDEEVEYLFDDGVSLMFWLNGTASDNCCRFVGGAFQESRYFGEGIGIMVAKGNDEVREVLDYGLFQLFESGKYLEIFLRYFPLSFY
jgi:polar amino acid transport system substrate-binding protein